MNPAATDGKLSILLDTTWRNRKVEKQRVVAITKDWSNHNFPLEDDVHIYIFRASPALSPPENWLRPWRESIVALGSDQALHEGTYELQRGLNFEGVDARGPQLLTWFGVLLTVSIRSYKIFGYELGYELTSHGRNCGNIVGKVGDILSRCRVNEFV